MKVSLLPLGCKVNQAEMSDIEGALRGGGHEIVGIGENPDVCVVNTCTVTSKSDYQSRQLIRRAGRTGARVIVSGCYSELNKEAVGRMEGVEKVVSNRNKSGITKLIHCNSEGNKLALSGRRSRYFLKVQDGCNNSCSYCIVPRARGSSRSASPLKVIESAKRAVGEGYREIVLTGIHLGQYGADIEGGSLSGLVENILKNTGVERLRLSSIEVNEVDDGLLGLLESPRVAGHLHIPLQSGDDGVLGMMNRGYDTAFFRDVIARIMGKLPDIALGTDVIAGFPRETEAAFQNSVDLIRELPFSYLHVFPYSRRPGTTAADMEDTVGDAARRERAGTLRAVGAQKKESYMAGQVGRTLGTLIESRPSEGTWRGTSCNYLKVRVRAGALERGSIVPIRVEGLREGELVGKFISNT
jgi:threonylcarbamoyladenosine tRNA methylthiotransferase MtaB